MPKSRNQILIRRGTTEALLGASRDGGAINNTSNPQDAIGYGEPVYDVDKGYLSIGIRKGVVTPSGDLYPPFKELFPIKTRTLQGWFADDANNNSLNKPADATATMTELAETGKYSITGVQNSNSLEIKSDGKVEVFAGASTEDASLNPAIKVNGFKVIIDSERRLESLNINTQQIYDGKGVGAIIIGDTLIQTVKNVTIGSEESNKNLIVNGTLMATGISTLKSDVNITGTTKIGTTITTASGALQVNGGAYISGNLSITNNGSFGGEAFTVGSMFNIKKANTPSTGVVSIKSTTASDTAASGALTVSGGVGIAGALNVGLTTKIGGKLTVSGGGCSITGDTSITETLTVGTPATTISSDIATRNLTTSGTTTLAGNVTIGALNNANLTIAGNVYVDTRQSSEAANGGSLMVIENDTCSWVGHIGSGGGISNPVTKAVDDTTRLVYANSFYASSDRRLKENIQPYQPTNSILDLEVKEYTWKKSSQKSFGFIAQEVRELFPEIVNGDESIEGEYLSIQEGKLSYLLLLEIKKLRKELDQLKTEVKR